jgi:hypothetical protein
MLETRCHLDVFVFDAEGVEVRDCLCRGVWYWVALDEGLGVAVLQCCTCLVK